MDAGRTVANLISNPFPNGIQQPSGASLGLATLLGQGPTFSDDSGTLGYVHSFSFGIQKQLRGQLSVDAAYVGSRTIAVPTTRGFNELPADRLGSRRCDAGRKSELPERAAAESVRESAARKQHRYGNRPAAATASAVSGIYELQPPGHPQRQGLVQLAAGCREQALLAGANRYGGVHSSKNIQALNYLNAQDALPSREPGALGPDAPAGAGADLRIAFWSGQAVLEQRRAHCEPGGRRLAIDDEYYLARRQSDDRAGQCVPTGKPEARQSQWDGC